MKQSDKRYWELSEKWLNGTITPEEEKEFAAWYNAGQDAPVEIPATFAADEQTLETRMLQHIQQHTHTVQPVVRRLLWPRIAVAAAILVIAGLSTYMWLKPALPAATAARKAVPATDLAPGSDKAVLTMPDGSQIVLDDARNGTLRSQQHLAVVKLDSGQLAYRASGNAVAGEVAYHTLSIPRGGHYQLVLSDGTKVWLNAASGIRFPTIFAGHERVVELSGEAYFEVAKNAAMPFRVKVIRQGKLGERENDDAEITVLGTHFNINAYADESAINTTLLEGSVKVVNHQSSVMSQQPVILKPGQQAAVSGQSPIEVYPADTEQAVAWKDGLFRFKKLDIESVMRQLSRWYDVDVVYEGHPITQHFNGTIPRNVSVSEVFKMLELTRTVHFEVAGKKIVVRSE